MARRAPVHTGRTSGKRGLDTGSGQMSWGFDVDPSPNELKRILGRELPKKLKDAWKPALAGAGLLMSSHILETIDSQGGTIGRRWPTNIYVWRDAYHRQKREGGFGNTPLVYSGKTRGQIEKKRPVSLTRTKVVVGFRHKRFPFVQYLQFHKKFWFIEWSKRLAERVQDVFSHHGRRIMGDVAQEVNRA